MSTTHFQIAYLLVGFSGTLLSNSFFLHASSLDARSIRQPLGSSPGGFFFSISQSLVSVGNFQNCLLGPSVV